MQKLTKEQSEWLIEQIKKARETSDTDFPTSGHTGYKMASDNITRIINQCTEKEFPRCEVDLGNGYESNAFLEGENICFQYIYKGVVEQRSLLYSPSQFKQFTEGCNKIVEWLNEQTY